MPSTVYKGDLAEVTFGHESGMVLQHGHFTNALSWSHTTSGDTSEITFAAATGEMFSAVAGTLAYPQGMLVGCMLRINGGGNYGDDDYTTTGRIYTVVANAGTTLTVSPALQTTAGGSASATDDVIIIDALGCPAPDPAGTTWHTNATTSDESVLTDQFVGLAATITLPETKMELLRSHVVGIGRDVVVHAPQKFTNEGGTLEAMMHSARWFYYCLGNEATADLSGLVGAAVIDTGANARAIAMGDIYVEFSGAVSGTLPVVGDYVHIVDADPVLIPTDRHDPAAGTIWTGAQTAFSRTETNEVRRVVAVDTRVGTARRIYVDDPFCFDHALRDAGVSGIQSVNKLEFNNAAALGSPHFDTATATYGTITNRVSRMLFSGWHTPSFALEASMRTRDVGSYTTEQSANAPGAANDSKQLTRVWKGCKVKDWGLTADADAEVKMTVNFDALHCYTDTGRLENANKGDRYTAHRMFENTGNGLAARKIAGIAPNTEKPFLFYNGSITAFGQSFAQVTNFNLTGNNNTVTHYTVRGNDLAEARNTAGDSLEQVPFGGSRNPALMVEGKVEYELSMTVIVSDPTLWHEFRTNRERDYTAPITLTLTKGGAGPNREQVIIIIDDYIITEAPLPIPDDKGVIKSEMKIMPKHVKVVAHDSLLHC